MPMGGDAYHQPKVLYCLMRYWQARDEEQSNA